MKNIKIIYLCDRKACNGACPNSECQYTYDIEHAVNFKMESIRDDLYFVEKMESEGVAINIDPGKMSPDARAYIEKVLKEDHGFRFNARKERFL